MRHLTIGLALLAPLPGTPERAQQELGLQIMLGPALAVTKGQQAPETERTYARACELARQVGDTPHRFPALYGFWYAQMATGQLPQAWVLGARTLWVLGYPDQALRDMEETLTRTRRLAHPFTLAQALAFSAMLHQLRREPQVALAQAEVQRALCTEQGFATYLAWGMMPRGWALAVQGQVAKGLAQLREGSPAGGPSAVNGCQRGHGSWPYGPRTAGKPDSSMRDCAH